MQIRRAAQTNINIYCPKTLVQIKNTVPTGLNEILFNSQNNEY